MNTRILGGLGIGLVLGVVVWAATGSAPVSVQQPSQYPALAARALALENWRANRVVDGRIINAPTTASTQASGAVAAVVRVNRTGGAHFVAGVLALAPGDSVDYSFGVSPPVLAIGESTDAGVIGCLSSGIATMFLVWGAPAATGAQALPSDVEIKAALSAVGRPISYIRIAKLTLNRTGDTTLTQSQDNTWRDF